MPVEAMMWLNFVNRDSGVPNFPLLPRVAWEKVPEGRMRALCSSSINMSDSFCYKNPPRRSAGRQEEPSPALRAPLYLETVVEFCSRIDVARGLAAARPLARRCRPSTLRLQPWESLGSSLFSRTTEKSLVRKRKNKAGYRDQDYLWSRYFEEAPRCPHCAG